MDRIDEIEIGEHLKDLQELELRIAMLRMMKQQPGITQKGLAEVLEVNERTVRRWQKLYRAGGMETLLSSGRNTVKSGVAPANNPVVLTLPADFQRFLRLLNALPQQGTPQQVSTQLSGLLIGFFADVDHAAVAINLECDLKAPHLFKPGMSVYHRELREGEHFQVVEYSEDTIVAGVLDTMRATGIEILDHNHPEHFTYWYGGAFLAAVVLWRDAGQPPIGRETLAFIHQIERFLIYVLSDVVARHAYDSPVDTAFNDALAALVIDAGLSTREHEVLVYLLRGQSQEETARAMKISPDAVKKRMKQVYIKTGTTNLPDLFGKYFTPQLTPPMPPELPHQE